MKQTNMIITIITIATVLVAAYAIGLLIRQARMSAKTDDIATTAQIQARQQLPARGGSRQVQTDDLAQKEAMLEKMKNMTEEEKRKFAEEQVLKRVDAGRREGSLRRPQPVREIQKEAPNSVTEPESGKNDSEPNDANRQ